MLKLHEFYCEKCQDSFEDLVEDEIISAECIYCGNLSTKIVSCKNITVASFRDGYKRFTQFKEAGKLEDDITDATYKAERTRKKEDKEELKRLKKELKKVNTTTHD